MYFSQTAYEYALPDRYDDQECPECGSYEVYTTGDKWVGTTTCTQCNYQESWDNCDDY